MKIISLIAVLFVVMYCLACTDQSYVDQKPQSGKLSDDNVFKDYETALDRAKGVEQTIQDAAIQRQKEMEQQGY
jgi:hypothetical protein